MTKDQNQARAILFRNKGQNTFHWLETKPKSGSWLRGTLFDIHWPSNAFTAIGFIFSTKQFILTTKEVLFKRSRNKLKIHQALSASSVIQWAVGDRENNRWWSEIQWQWNEIWWQEEVTGCTTLGNKFQSVSQSVSVLSLNSSLTDKFFNH